MSEQTLIFLGTGAGDCSSERAKTSLLLRTKSGRENPAEEWILLDVGDGCVGNVHRVGACWENLRAIILSHGHSDHLSALPLIFQCMALSGRKEPLIVHTPEYLKDPIQSWMASLSLNPMGLPYGLEFKEIREGEEIAAAGFRVLSHGTKHDSSNGRQSFGFQIESARRRIFYSSDIAGAVDLERIRVSGARDAIVELAHISPAELCEVLKGVQLQRLYLTHIGGGYYSNRREILADIAQALPQVDQVIEAQDLMEILL